MYAAGHGRAAHHTHLRFTSDVLRPFNDRLPFLEHHVGCLFRLAQVGVGQHRALRLEAQRSVQHAHHTAHRRERGRYQRADGNHSTVPLRISTYFGFFGSMVVESSIDAYADSTTPNVMTKKVPLSAPSTATCGSTLCFLLP